jgi:acetolactate synthase-1/2/3 large subunit
MESALAARLTDLGLTTAFGITGSGSSWKLITALEALGTQYFPATHEAAAAIMAGGAWRATQRPSLSVGIKGPGLANMLAGIAFNQFENLPVLSLCEAYGIKTPSFRMHKRLDQATLLSAVCKGSLALPDAVDRLGELNALARAEVPGPVHIDLCDSATVPVPWRTEGLEPGSPEVRDQVIDRITRSQRPLLIVGSLALRREWGSQLAALRIPVLTTAAAKGVLNESAPNVLGVYTGDGKPAVPEASVFQRCDLIVAIGLRNLEMLSPKKIEQPMLWIDEASVTYAKGFDPAVIWRTHHSTDYEQLLELLAQKQWGEDVAAAARSRLLGAAQCDKWLPAACFDALNRLDYSCSLAVDTGSFCTIAEHYWLAAPTRKYFGSSNGRFMGGSIPTAIGAAAADPQTPVFCVSGDGGFRMYVAELTLAVARQLPVCFVLMSDGRYGSVVAGASRAGLSASAVEMPGASWLRVIERMGCEAQAANSAAQFSDLVRGWGRNQPLYIECNFEPEAYAAMTRDLR